MTPDVKAIESTQTDMQRAPEPLYIKGISLGDSARIALAALEGSKLRTFLTALGVVIGVAAVIALLAIGQGAQEQIAESITANGANLLTVRSQGAAAGQSQLLTIADAEALADHFNVPHGALVSPEYSGVGTVSAGSESQRTMVLGVTSSYVDIHNNTLQSGEFFTDADSRSSVVVLGATAAANLFPDQDPVGQSVRIQGQSFRVLGVLQSKGASVMNFDDESVLVPLEVAQTKLFRERVAGAGGKAAVSSIVVQASDSDSIQTAYDEIAATLRERHDLPMSGSGDDFTIVNQQSLIDTLSQSSETMTMYLSAIAAISLIVGGIGIMNIMLVSVRERTREIGLRKAIGARERDILAQFLIETVTLSTTGGVIGLLLGVLVAFAANQTGQSRASVSPESLILAIGFAMAIGLFFGIDPARRAAKLDPIEALRHE